MDLRRVGGVVLGALAVALTACAPPRDQAKTGKSSGVTGLVPVTVNLTDAPLPSSRISRVLVVVRSLELLDENGGRQVLLDRSDEPVTVDAFALRNGELRTLGKANVPPGNYASARISFGDAVVTLTGGQDLEARPVQTSVTVPIGLSVTTLRREVLLDLDLARSITFLGSLDVPSGFTFEPVLRGAVVGTGGTLRGKVTDPSGRPVSGATITLLSDDVPFASTIAARDGSFTVLEVPLGGHSVRAETPTGVSRELDVNFETGRSVTVSLVVRETSTGSTPGTDGSTSGTGGDTGGTGGTGGDTGGTPTPPTLALADLSSPDFVQPGEQIRITWSTQGESPIKASSVRWGNVSGIYSMIGPVHSSSLGSSSFAEIVVAPSRSKTVFFQVRAEDEAGHVVESAEQRVAVEWPGMTGGLIYEKLDAIAIPDSDATGITIPFDVAEVGSLANVEVRIDIQHPARTDLALELIAPSGRSIRLYEGDPTGTTLDHLDASHADIYCTFNGSVRMLDDPSVLLGEAIQGRWLLRVVDRVPEGEGTLYNATLMLQRFGDATAADEMLPNLVTLPPDEVTLFFDAEGKHLRLSNTVANYGRGPLELRGVVDPLTGDTRAFQRIFRLSTDSTGKPIWEVVREKLVGAFVFAAHKDHNHFHFDNFARYTLFDETFRFVAESAKVSHCLEDYKWLDAQVPNSKYLRVYTCSPTIQGISLGWADYYGAGLEGQSIKITGIPDGNYYLVSSCTQAFEESNPDKNDNTGATRLSIVGSTVTVLERLDGAEVARRRALFGN